MAKNNNVEIEESRSNVALKLVGGLAILLTVLGMMIGISWSSMSSELGEIRESRDKYVLKERYKCDMERIEKKLDKILDEMIKR